MLAFVEVAQKSIKTVFLVPNRSNMPRLLCILCVEVFQGVKVISWYPFVCVSPFFFKFMARAFRFEIKVIIFTQLLNIHRLWLWGCASQLVTGLRTIKARL